MATFDGKKTVIKFKELRIPTTCEVMYVQWMW